MLCGGVRRDQAQGCSGARLVSARAPRAQTMSVYMQLSAPAEAFCAQVLFFRKLQVAGRRVVAFGCRRQLAAWLTGWLTNVQRVSGIVMALSVQQWSTYYTRILIGSILRTTSMGTAPANRAVLALPGPYPKVTHAEPSQPAPTQKMQAHGRRGSSSCQQPPRDHVTVARCTVYSHQRSCRLHPPFPGPVISAQ